MFQGTIKTIRVAAAATTILAAVAGPIAAYSAPAEPILVSNFHVNVGDTEQPTPDFLSLTFENEANSTAKVVVFHLTNADGNQTLLTDAGTFSKGVPITDNVELNGFRNAQVEVESVHFEDGSVWQPHYPSPPTLEQQRG